MQRTQLWHYCGLRRVLTDRVPYYPETKMIDHDKHKCVLVSTVVGDFFCVRDPSIAASRYPILLWSKLGNYIRVAS